MNPSRLRYRGHLYVAETALEHPLRFYEDGFYRLSGIDWKPGTYPRLCAAMDRWGVPQVVKVLRQLQLWYGGDYMGQAAGPEAVLHSPILPFISPPGPLPATLYRGVRLKHALPATTKQLTASNARPWQSWTSNHQLAREYYCSRRWRPVPGANHDPTGACFVAATSALQAHAVLFTWPAMLTGEYGKAFGVHAFNHDLMEVQEWAWYLKSRVPLLAAEACDD